MQVSFLLDQLVAGAADSRGGDGPRSINAPSLEAEPRPYLCGPALPPLASHGGGTGES